MNGAITRYLNKIAVPLKNSQTTKSKYFRLDFSDRLSIKIRYSDHFSTHDEKYLNIIKLLDYYCIKDDYTGSAITVHRDELMYYLKSYLLLFPEKYESWQSNNNLISTLQTKFRHYKHLYEDLDEIEQMINDSKKEIQDWKRKYATLFEEHNKLKKKHQTLSQQYTSSQEKLNKIKKLC